MVLVQPRHLERCNSLDPVAHHVSLSLTNAQRALKNSYFPIDTPFIAQNFPQRYALKNRQGILDPEAVVENHWQLHRQPGSPCTLDYDLRPWIEPV